MTSPSYRAAVERAAWRLRGDRVRLQVEGRAPGQMLQGLLTQRVPGPERPVDPEVLAGRAAYSAVLTPKGRMITDLRILRVDAVGPEVDPGAGRTGVDAGAPAAVGPGGAGAVASGLARGPAATPGRGGGGERFLLDVPAAGRAALEDHFGRFLPPRFARVADVTEDTAMLTVVGPDAAAALCTHALGLRVDEHVLEGLGEGEYRTVDAGGAHPLRVIRSLELGVDGPAAFDLLGDRAALEVVAETLGGAGVADLTDDAWEVLAVEGGRSRFGVEIDGDTLPLEAGLGPRAIDHGKGCYTGQEVVVRIRDRGHVNRRLARVRLGSAEPPAPGTELAAAERGDRSAGEVRSAVRSPRYGETVALAWVRREVPDAGTVRVGGAGGAEGIVEPLEE